MIYSGVAGLTFTASWKAIAFPFAFERIFSETNRIDKTYYLTGDEVGAAADFAKTYVENFFMTCEYYPYSF